MHLEFSYLMLIIVVPKDDETFAVLDSIDPGSYDIVEVVYH